MINTDLDSDYSYYTPNRAVVTAENSNISNTIMGMLLLSTYITVRSIIGIIRVQIGVYHELVYSGSLG